MKNGYMKSILLAVNCIALLVGCKDKLSDYTSYVDPKIGSGGHGHVFVGANVPFGMVQLGPTSIPQDWDWCSGYHDSDSTVIGFSHTHLSGTGIGDLFDMFKNGMPCFFKRLMVGGDGKFLQFVLQAGNFRFN